MLGVLGGMGPLATIDFMEKIVRNTPAAYDQQHIQTLICSATDIPDRTAAIMGGGRDPFPAMLRALRRLERAGADIIAIPCNTAHFWHSALQEQTSVPILHIVDAVVEKLQKMSLMRGYIGLLATDGTIKAGFYDKLLTRQGMSILRPTSEGQVSVMQAIRLVKAGDLEAATAILISQAQILATKCDAIVMACTEIPIALADAPSELRLALIDATEALAVSCVRICTG